VLFVLICAFSLLAGFIAAKEAVSCVGALIVKLAQSIFAP
jgi:hypothetical protein